MSKYYKEIKKAEEEFREVISRLYNPSLSFDAYKEIDKLIEPLKEEISKINFEIGFSNIENDIIPTEKMMRVNSFALAYHQFCIFSGQNIDFDHAFFDLYKLYGEGKSLPEIVLMNPVFMLSYYNSMILYKASKKKL